MDFDSYYIKKEDQKYDFTSIISDEKEWGS
jgi:hypothetical protein